MQGKEGRHRAFLFAYIYRLYLFIPIILPYFASDKLIIRLNSMEKGRKNDIQDDKLRWDLLPLDLIEKIVEVYHFGAKKYAPNSWKQLENGEQRYKAALLRHLTAHDKGEVYDSESGLLHMQHACWNAIAVLYFAIQKEKELTKN